MMAFPKSGYHECFEWQEPVFAYFFYIINTVYIDILYAIQYNMTKG
jgi:hypothetical protein